jgi:hypothetical protein
MRWKIISANAAIVLVVGFVAYAILMSSMSDVVSNSPRARTVAAQAVRSGTARLALDALKLERWLTTRVRHDSVGDVFASGTVKARQDSATIVANRIRDEVAQNPAFVGMSPSLVLFVDVNGTALGRNGSALMRGEKVGDTYSTIRTAILEGSTLNDVWINTQRQEQMLVSVAAVRGEGDAVVGAVVVGVPLNDERLKRTAELTSGQILLFGMLEGNRMEVVAKSDAIPAPLLAEVSGPTGAQSAQLAVHGRSVEVGEALAGEWGYAASGVEGYLADKMVIVAVAPSSIVGSHGGFLFPVLGATAIGLVLVIVVGSLLGNYLSRPISELEDGLLAIINGNSALRFQIEHAELGGLVFRINSLLNALMGVDEDNTDDQGRPSAAPTANDFREALDVDESSVASQQVNPEQAAALLAEPAERYYHRMYAEYLAARRQIGDPVEGVSYDSVVQHLMASEREMSGKYGRPVRHVIDVRDGGIVLVAIPLE